VLIRTITIGLILLACSYVYRVQAAPQSGEDINDKVAKAGTLLEQGELQQARGIYESVLPRLRVDTPSVELADTLDGLSQIANAEGRYEDAVSLAHESAAIFHHLGKIYGEAKAYSGEAKGYNDSGFAYMNAGKYPEAAHDLELALNLGNRSGVATTPVLSLNNLGSVYYYQAKYSEAFRA